MDAGNGSNIEPITREMTGRSADRFSTILKIGPLPTPCHPRVHQGEASLAARSIENVFHLHRSPSPTARRRDIAGIRVLKGRASDTAKPLPRFR
jgi:hypothetical protein